MSKRPLSKEEKDICEKQIDRLKREIKKNEIKRKVCELDIERHKLLLENVPYWHEDKMKELEMERNKTIEDQALSIQTIQTLKDQVSTGVEQKGKEV